MKASCLLSADRWRQWQREAAEARRDELNNAKHTTGTSALAEQRKAGTLTAVAAGVGERYPVYELLALFAAYTGLRAEELAGCEVGDLVFILVPAGVRVHIEVRRAIKRRAHAQQARRRQR